MWNLILRSLQFEQIIKNVDLQPRRLNITLTRDATMSLHVLDLCVHVYLFVGLGLGLGLLIAHRPTVYKKLKRGSPF